MKKLVILLLCAFMLVSCGDTVEKDASREESGVESDVSEPSEGALLKQKIIRGEDGSIVTTVTYTYDEFEHLIKEVESDGNGLTTSVIEYIYVGGVVSEENHYDVEENLTDSIRYIYGDDGKIETERHSDGSTVKYGYNEKGLLNMQDYGTNLVIYRYTAEGILGQRLVVSGETIVASTEYAYYEDGMLGEEVDISSYGEFTLRYTYNNNKVLVSAVITNSNGVVMQNIEYIY